jgi:two-component system alkaline phosphatase synthesis response regulator PhoP
VESPRTVLVVDDEPTVREIVGQYLTRDGFRVVSAGDGREVMDLVELESPDLIVLDIMLPGIGGLELCRSIRARRAIPVILLTARGEETDRIVGLELGADDYVTKPFSPRELVARVRAVLRRAEGVHETVELVRAGDVELDTARMLTTVAGRRVELTPTEFRLLLELARQPGRVFTRSQLLSAVQGVAFESYERAIDAHVKNLRRKIEDEPHSPRRLQTVFGVGYRMAEEGSS